MKVYKSMCLFLLSCVALLVLTGRIVLSEEETIFFDKDINYDVYYEYSIKLIRQGGIIAIDNVLWGGRIIDDSAQEPAARALRKLNKKLHNDQRVDISMIPVGDGLLLARKK